MRPAFAFVLLLCCLGVLLLVGREAAAAKAAASATISSGTLSSRTTIPITIDGRRASCILDTGSSAMLVSPALARAAGLVSEGGTFEVAPDGQTYADRETTISRFGVAGYWMRGVRALITSNLTGYNALCGYDFFTRFPTLIDRARRSVTLFPPPSKISHLHCLPVDLSPRVPVATIEINGTWLSQIVLDSGMSGGGALWDGVRARLRRPLVSYSDYPMNRNGMTHGLSCGAFAFVRFAPGTAGSSMPMCTEELRPDGYNGIVETNLSAIAAMAVDYPHRRVCFDVAGFSPERSPAKSPGIDRGAWSRFDYLRPP